MEKFIFRKIKNYVKNLFPSEYKEICRRQKEIFPKMMANAPDLGGCPLVQYAKKYGYMELLPHMCKLDHQYAKLMHAKLIRTHTVATGADSCDYWYVPDKSETAINYSGVII